MTDNNRIHLGIQRQAASKHASEGKTVFYLNVEGSEARDDLKQVVSQEQISDGHKQNISVQIYVQIIIILNFIYDVSHYTILYFDVKGVGNTLIRQIN